MTSGIYAYWDNVNGYYAYVGKDSNIDRNIRHKQHLQLCRYDVQPFNKVIQNNPDRYEYRVIMEGGYNDWQLNQMEKLCIKSFKTFKYDYPARSVFNFTKGGEGSSGIVLSDKTIKKKSESQTGRKHTKESKQKMSESHTGKILTDEHKEKISRGRNTSGYLNVSKVKNRRCSQGFHWLYQYYENGKRKAISSIDLKKLEKKVKDKGLTWKKL